MGVNDQLRTSAAIPMRKEPLMPVGYDVSVYSGKEKDLSPYGYCPSSNLVTVVTELHWLIARILVL